jgi:hypothetical protein
MFNSGWSGGNNNSDNEIGTMLAWLGGIGIAGMAAKKIIDKLTESLREFKAELADTAAEEDKILVVNGGGNGGNMGDMLFPALAAVAGAAAIGLGVEEALRRYYRTQAKQRIEYFQLIPHAEYGIDAERIHNLAASFHQAGRSLKDRLVRGREWFQLYFVCVPDESRGEDGRIEIYVGFPRDRFSFVKKKLDQAFPKCGFKRVHWSKVPQLSAKGTGGFVQHQDMNRAGFPLQAFKGKDQMTGILDHLMPGSALAITFSPTVPRVIKRSMQKTRKSFYKRIGFDPKEMRKNDLDPDIKQSIDDLDARERKTRGFEVKIALWQEKEAYGDVVASIRDELNSRLAGEYVGFRLKKTLRNPINITPYSVYPMDWLINMLAGIPYATWQKPLVMLLNEFENLFHLPNGMTAEQRKLKVKHLYDRIDHIIPGQSEIPVEEFAKGVNFGYLLNPVQDYRPIYLLSNVVRKHGTIIGGTGSGKTALAMMACKSIVLDRLKRKNGGLSIVDPKRTFAYGFLTWLNKLKLEGVLTEEHESLFRFYDVTSDEFCFSINPMEKWPNMTRQQKHNVTRNTLEIMKSTFQGESILFEQYAGTAVKCLLEDPKRDHTLLAIPAFLEKESLLRDRLYAFLRNGDTYQKELAKEIERLDFAGRESATVYNRLHRLRDNPRTKRIFGQAKTTVSPLESQEKGLITIYNVEGLEQEEINLIMGYILMEYHKAANKRTNHAENHLLFIDEAHQVQPECLHTQIIPKDREFGLCLWLMTQAFHQFSAPLVSTIKDIGGTIISFKTGDESAPVIEKATTGRVKATDAMNYRALTGAIDTEDSKGDRRTVMVKSDPPIVWNDKGEPTYYGSDKQRETEEKNAAYKNAWQKLGRPLMERDCRPVSEVEKEIDQYLETLWKGGSSSIRLTNAEAEAAAATEGNVISFRQKEESQEQPKAVNENPFLRRHLQKEKEEEDE